MPLTERTNIRRSQSNENGSAESGPINNNSRSHEVANGHNDDDDDVNEKGSKKAMHRLKKRKRPLTALLLLMKTAWWRIGKDLDQSKTKSKTVAKLIGFSFVLLGLMSQSKSQSLSSISLWNFSGYKYSINADTRWRSLPKRQLVIHRPDFNSAESETKSKSKSPSIMLQNFGKKNSEFYTMPVSDLKSPNVDYGGLQLNFISPGADAAETFERKIRPDPTAMEGHVWTKKDYEHDGWEEYYAFDDDFVRSVPYKELKKYCRRTEWHRRYEPNCNTFHEIPIMQGTNRKLGSGAYRDVFLLHETYDPNLVVKVQRYRRNPFKMDRYEFIRMDALVMERLSSSPRISDIYGHCATSINSEYLPTEIESMVVHGEGDGSHMHEGDVDVRPNNDLTPSMRLDIALQMAESIADLHGFKDGVIVHDDIQLVQFLFTPDGRLKLNDFNRAEAMLYDEKDGSYCKYQNGKGGGEYRAPEEYKDDWLNEKIDVWSFGNNIYTMLTGLWPFYGNDPKDYEKKMIDGETAYLDPRHRGKNYIHDKLIEIMERCWIYKADERIDIFEIIKLLRDLKVEALRQGIYEESSFAKSI